MIIDQAKKNILIEEVLIQCVLALNHYAEATALLDHADSRQSRFVWAHLHAFLVQAGMVSKMFLPPQKTPISKERKNELRSTLKIGDSSPIFDRAARDNVEHFDERLDQWLQADSGGLLEMVFETRSDFDFLFRDGRKQAVRRVLIRDEMTLILPGREGLQATRLALIRDEIKSIALRAKSFLEADATVTRISPLWGRMDH
jgi:hypothetical protein